MREVLKLGLMPKLSLCLWIGFLHGETFVVHYGGALLTTPRIYTVPACGRY